MGNPRSNDTYAFVRKIDKNTEVWLCKRCGIECLADLTLFIGFPSGIRAWDNDACRSIEWSRHWRDCVGQHRNADIVRSEFEAYNEALIRAQNKEANNEEA